MLHVKDIPQEQPAVASEVSVQGSSNSEFGDVGSALQENCFRVLRETQAFMIAIGLLGYIASGIDPSCSHRGLWRNTGLHYGYDFHSDPLFYLEGPACQGRSLC